MRRLDRLLWPMGLALGLTAESVSPGWSEPRQWIPDLAVGWTFIGCGLIALSRRPESRSGVLMAATGFTWFIGNFAEVRFGAVAWLAAHGVFVHRGPLVHLILAYPSGRISSRLTRVAVVAGYLAAFALPVWASEVLAMALAALLVAVSAREYSLAIGRFRRAHALSLLAAAGFSAVVAGGAAVRLALPDASVSVPSLFTYAAVLCTIAVGLLVGLVSTAWDQVAVTDLVVELGEAHPGTLRGELAKALGDPSLEVGYWLRESGEFVDSEGRTLPLPAPDSDRSMTVVERDGRPIAVLVHDRAVLEEPGLVEAVASAARLAASNARLQAELQTRVAELAASRRRILEAGDEERRRLERRLRDGAERLLVELTHTLRRSRADSAQERTRAQIAHAERALELTLDDLRRLAHGLHPQILSDEGLASAVARLAEGAPIPVETEIASQGIPPRVAAAAYFVCAEALANVAKHSSASRVTVGISSDHARVAVRVEDDGIGGADPSLGSGLRGLADRIETLGGNLQVDSPPGHGTRLAAEISLGGETD
jgi:signal transduction histidine kinase